MMDEIKSPIKAIKKQNNVININKEQWQRKRKLKLLEELEKEAAKCSWHLLLS